MSISLRNESAEALMDVSHSERKRSRSASRSVIAIFFSLLAFRERHTAPTPPRASRAIAYPHHTRGEDQGLKVCWAGAAASWACCRMLFQETIKEL